MSEAVRWTIKVSPETDLSLRGFLGAQGMKKQARHYFSRKLKWGPSDFSSEKSRGGQCLRLPGFVLGPLRRTTPRCCAVHHGYPNDLTPCRTALHFDYASARATTPSKHRPLRLSGGAVVLRSTNVTLPVLLQCYV